MKAEKFVRSPESKKKVTFKKVFGKKVSVKDLNKEEQIAYYEQKLRNLKRRLKAIETIESSPNKYHRETLRKAHFEAGGIYSKIWKIERRLKKLREEWK